MSLIARDTFTAANSTAITSRAGELGATWTKNTAYSAATQTTYWGKAIGGGLIHPSGTPSTADYSVAVEFVQRSASGSPKLFARALNSALTGYCAEFAAATGLWTIKRYVSGGATQLGSSYSKAFVAGAKVHARLLVSGTGATVVLQLYLDGVLAIDTTDTSGSRLTAAGLPGLFIVGGTYITETGFDNFTVEEAGTDHVTLFELEANQIIQRDSAGSSSSALRVRGTYGGSPTGIEARIVDASDGTTVIKDWTALSSLTMQNGYYSGLLAGAPNGAWYYLQVRFAGGGASFSSTKRFGIGLVVGLIGQSNIANWTYYNAGCADDDKVWCFDAAGWRSANTVCTGCAALAFGTTLRLATGLPVALLNYAASGTALLAKVGGATFWADSAALSMADKYRWGIIEAAGGKIDCTVWGQGEADAKFTGTEVTKAEYLAGLTTLFNNVRGYAGDSAHPIHLMPLATDSTATIDSEWQSVRNAQMQKIDDDPYCYIGGVGYDLTMAGVHYATASYPTIATRSALAVLRRLGVGGGYGPRITGAVKSSPTVYDVAVEHDNGTDITPVSGVTGFKVFDGSTPVEPSSVVRQSANTVRITLASPPSGDVTIYNLYGALPTVTSPVKDNSVPALPLWPTGPVTATTTAQPLAAPFMSSASVTYVPAVKGFFAVLAGFMSSVTSFFSHIVGQAGKVYPPYTAPTSAVIPATVRGPKYLVGAFMSSVISFFTPFVHFAAGSATPESRTFYTTKPSRSFRTYFVTDDRAPSKAPWKYAGDVLDFVLDWTRVISSGEWIVNSVWDTPDGIVKVSDRFSDTQGVIWLSGGVEGSGYMLKNTVTTNQGRVMVDYIYIEVRAR